jgi:hypothetical protein
MDRDRTAAALLQRVEPAPSSGPRADPAVVVERLVSELEEEARQREGEARARAVQRLFDLD